MLLTRPSEIPVIQEAFPNVFFLTLSGKESSMEDMASSECLTIQKEHQLVFIIIIKLIGVTLINQIV